MSRDSLRRSARGTTLPWRSTRSGQSESSPAWSAQDKLSSTRQASSPPTSTSTHALILKPREGIEDDAPEDQRYKARLIVDLRRGQVNAHLPHVGVKYGALEQAILKNVKGFLDARG